MNVEPSLLTRSLETTLGRLTVDTGEGTLDFSARIGQPEGAGWVLTSDLVKDSELLEALLGRIQSSRGIENRAYAGTNWVRSYLWTILTTAVAAFLLERRIPDLRAENVSLHFGDGGFAEALALSSPRFFSLPDDPEAGHPDAVVLPSEEALLAWMREPIAETHLQELIPTLRSLRIKRGTRVLRRLGTDAFAEAFMSVGQAADREAEALDAAEKLLAGPSPLSGPANYFVLEYEGGSAQTRVRNTCCLHYKVAGSTCLTCPRTTDEERRERLAAS